jgi:1,4-dihydroxy-2-naphthoate octaprenyltransferase
MGLSLIPPPLIPPHARVGTAAADGTLRGGLPRLLGVLSLVRYRFFLYAGLLPCLLGAAWAFRLTGDLDGPMFWSGLGGVALSVVGVEAFKAYFESRMGTDRVFDARDLPPMSDWVLWLGVAGFAGALATGVYLTSRAGGPILVFAGLGGLAAAFYVAPPVRWAYRGLGETVIALPYGPWMVLGSLYLHARLFDWGALLASLVPGLLIMALALVNAIPDFHQDRLVGKRNLCVRLGRLRAVWLHLALAAAALLTDLGGVLGGVFPPLAWRPCWHCRCCSPARGRRAAPTPRRACSFRRSAASSPATPSRCRCSRPRSPWRPGWRQWHERRASHRPAACAAVRLVAAHPRLRSGLSALLHRVRSRQASARRIVSRRGAGGGRRHRAQ